MTRVLLTGGSGFVGSNLVRRLVAEGHDVHLLLRPTARLWRIDDLRHNTTVHCADLSDTAKVHTAMREAQPEWVFHLAVYGAYPSQTGFHEMVHANLLGTAHLLEAAVEAGVGVFVNTGSSSEYGPKEHPPTEEEALGPESHYAITKAAATALCTLTGRREQMYVPTLRLYSVFGPYEDPGRLMPTLVRHALKGEWPPLADPSIAHDFVYVEDVVDAYLLVAAGASTAPERGPVYNVGTGVQTSLGTLAEITRRLFNLPGEPTWGGYPARDWDRAEWRADPSRLMRTLGWQPRFDIERGLQAMANHMARS